MKTVIAEIIIGKNIDASFLKVVKAPRDVRDLISEGRVVAEMMNEDARDDNYQVIEFNNYEDGIYTVEFNWDGEDLTPVSTEKKEINAEGTIMVASIDGGTMFLEQNDFFDVEKHLTEIFNAEECKRDIEDFAAGFYKVTEIDLDSEEEMLVAKFTKIKA